MCNYILFTGEATVTPDEVNKAGTPVYGHLRNLMQICKHLSNTGSRWMCGLASCETSLLVHVCTWRFTEYVHLTLLSKELWAPIYTVTDHLYSTNNQQQQRNPTTNFEEMRMTFQTTPIFCSRVRQLHPTRGPHNSLKTRQRAACLYIQGVPGGIDKTSGECSLCWTIPI